MVTLYVIDLCHLSPERYASANQLNNLKSQSKNNMETFKQNYQRTYSGWRKAVKRHYPSALIYGSPFHKVADTPLEAKKDSLVRIAEWQQDIGGNVW